MKPHIAHFNLRLAAGRSIGYATLRDIWHQAAGSKDVSLRKTSLGQQPRAGAACVYTLCAKRELAELAQVESRLRALLSEGLVGPAMQLTRLG
jgi:hypothetical protein